MENQISENEFAKGFDGIYGAKRIHIYIYIYTKL